MRVRKFLFWLVWFDATLVTIEIYAQACNVLLLAASLENESLPDDICGNFTLHNENSRNADLNIVILTCVIVNITM